MSRRSLRAEDSARAIEALDTYTDAVEELERTGELHDLEALADALNALEEMREEMRDHDAGDLCPRSLDECMKAWSAAMGVDAPTPAGALPGCVDGAWASTVDGLHALYPPDSALCVDAPRGTLSTGRSGWRVVEECPGGVVVTPGERRANWGHQTT